MKRYGCIEAGGTKFVVGVIDAEGAIQARARFDTRTPDETIPTTIDWLKDQGGMFDAIGIASFGPVRIDPAAPDWGHMLATTKPGWSDADIAGPYARAFGCPVGFDTDVNGAALAENLWGASVGTAVSAYLTIGTGIGGGAVVNGAPLHGLLHPEMGHAGPPRHHGDTSFAGVCPFHGACYEGLASGPAVIARWGASLSDLPADHPGHDIIAFYLAHLCRTLSAVLSPQRIVLGGGVMSTPGLLARVRAHYKALIGGAFAEWSEDRIVAPGLGADAGLFGALALATRRNPD